MHKRLKRYGEIKDVIIATNKYTKESRGYAFVFFSKASEAARALEECEESKAVFLALVDNTSSYLIK